VTVPLNAVAHARFTAHAQAPRMRRWKLMGRAMQRSWNMRGNNCLGAMGLCLGVLINLHACRQYIPDYDGTYVANSADVQADRTTMNDILSSFKQAEAALKRRDIDGIMKLYSDSYKHQSFDKVALRAVWVKLFEEHHDFSTTHVFTQVRVEAQTAQIRCTGSLWAVSNATNERVNLDSWFGEVHYMVSENGAWHIRGNAWEVRSEKQPQFARPPHPFF
jgi:hypothetical protein